MIFNVLVILFFIFAVALFLIFQNYSLKKTYYNISSEKIPISFNGLKILHLSDIHRKVFGKNQKYLVDLIKKENPDLIIVSGDIIYCYNKWYNFRRNYNKDLKNVMKIFEELKRIYPVFYAPGNHECKSKIYPEVKKALTYHGVTILDNDFTFFVKGDEKIAILGLIDPTFYGGTNEVKESYIKKAETKLSELMKSIENNFSILISHRPEIHKIYKSNNVDIVFSGHAHGGQWRLPIIGALYSPGQGLFPKYTSGIHVFDKTNLVISRGMGNSSFPIRLFNRPEIVIVTLESDMRNQQ